MRSALLSSLALLLAACGDGGSTSPAACQLACQRAAVCQPPADARACTSACATGPGYPYASPYPEPALSPRYLDAVRRCLDGVPCSSADFYGASDACARDAALRLKPSKAADELCRRALTADGYCGTATLSGYACLDTVKIYDDAALRRARSCYDAPCSTQPACVDQTLGYLVPPY